MVLLMFLFTTRSLRFLCCYCCCYCLFVSLCPRLCSSLLLPCCCVYFLFSLFSPPVVTLMFTQPIYDVTEGQPSVTVCLELSGADLPTASPIWANISTSDGDAIGMDYECTLPAICSAIIQYHVHGVHSYTIIMIS